jgi:hypothetical protein
MTKKENQTRNFIMQDASLTKKKKQRRNVVFFSHLLPLDFARAKGN